MNTESLVELSAIQSLANQTEDIGIRVTKLLNRQIDTKKQLHSIRDDLKDMEIEIESVPEDEEADETRFPDDYRFTEDLQNILNNMQASQKAWIESVQEAADVQTGLKDSKFFKEINKQLSGRLEYLEMAKNLLQGPLLEELPTEEEKPPEPEPDDKGKKGKGKKKK